MILTSTVFDGSTRVTDGRTDGRAIACSRYAYSMLLRAKMDRLIPCGLLSVFEQ